MYFLLEHLILLVKRWQQSQLILEEHSKFVEYQLS